MTTAEKVGHRGRCLKLALEIHDTKGNYSLGGMDRPAPINSQTILDTAAKLFKFVETGKTK